MKKVEKQLCMFEGEVVAHECATWTLGEREGPLAPVCSCVPRKRFSVRACVVRAPHSSPAPSHAHLVVARQRLTVRRRKLRLWPAVAIPTGGSLRLPPAAAVAAATRCRSGGRSSLSLRLEHPLESRNLHLQLKRRRPPLPPNGGAESLGTQTGLGSG